MSDVKELLPVLEKMGMLGTFAVMWWLERKRNTELQSALLALANRLVDQGGKSP